MPCTNNTPTAKALLPAGLCVCALHMALLVCCSAEGRVSITTAWDYLGYRPFQSHSLGGHQYCPLQPLLHCKCIVSPVSLSNGPSGPHTTQLWLPLWHWSIGPSDKQIQLYTGGVAVEVWTLCPPSQSLHLPMDGLCCFSHSGWVCTGWFGPWASQINLTQWHIEGR